jgi:beta-glucosidase
VRDLTTAVQASHHLLLAHGRAVPVLRAASPGAQVGITLNLHPVLPATSAEGDLKAVRRADGYQNRWFLDPVYGRGYPKDMLEIFGNFLPRAAVGETAEIGAPTDFLGVNYYFPMIVRAAPPPTTSLGFFSRTPAELATAGYELTHMNWPVAASGLFDLLTRLQRDYAPKAMYITENGAAYDDQLVNGKVDDPKRIAYLYGHLGAAQQAIAAGAALRGYFLWTLMDNFEWAYGYTRRFGIVYTDYPSLTRIPKSSFAWYKKVIAANAL